MSRWARERVGRRGPARTKDQRDFVLAIRSIGSAFGGGVGQGGGIPGPRSGEGRVRNVTVIERTERVPNPIAPLLSRGMAATTTSRWPESSRRRRASSGARWWLMSLRKRLKPA